MNPFCYISLMKTLTLLFCLGGLIGCSQKLTYADLNGVWRQACTFDTVHNSYFHFIDSNHVIEYNYIMGDNPGIDTTSFTFSIDNSQPVTLIHLFNKEYTNANYYWFIKIEDGILKAQGGWEGKGVVPTNWDNYITLMNTAPFFKVDKVGSYIETPSHKKWLDIQMEKFRNHKN